MWLSCHSTAAIISRKEYLNSLLDGLHRGRQTLAPAEARWGAGLLVTRKPATAAFKRSPGDDAFLTGFEGTFKSPAFLFARCIHRAPGCSRPRAPGRGSPGSGSPGPVGGGRGWSGGEAGREAGCRILGRGTCEGGRSAGWAVGEKAGEGEIPGWRGAGPPPRTRERFARLPPPARVCAGPRLRAAPPPPSLPASPPSPPPPLPEATETTARKEGKVTPGTSAGISPGAMMTPSRGATKPRSLRNGVPAAALSI